MLLVDGAYPPGPAELVADVHAIGGAGSFIYVWGGFTNYQLAHVEALQAANLAAVPIIVPGSRPGSAVPMLAACQRYSFRAGPVVFDFETGSEPANAWWDGARDLFRAAGFRAERYGTTAELGLYDPGDDDWIASWIEKGTLARIPQLPAGWHAWQFVNDVSVNGHQYDVSVVDPEFLSGAQDMTGEQDALLRAVYNFLLYGADADHGTAVVSTVPKIYNFLKFGTDGQAGDSVLVPLRGEVDQLAARPALSLSPADIQAIAAALPHVSPDDVQAIATATLQRIGKAASAA